MVDKLKSIMDAADKLTVDAIAQEPFSASTADPIESVLIYALHEGFDLVPMHNANGELRWYIETEKLKGLSSWTQVATHERTSVVDRLVAREAPVLSILDRIMEGPLLCLRRNGIDGIVTMYDLNQPPARAFGFALVMVVEDEVGRTVQEALAEGKVDPAQAADAVGVNNGEIQRWRTRQKNNDHLPLVTSLSLGAKLRLLRRYGLDRLFQRLALKQAAAPDIDRLLNDLGEVRKLRNDLAHNTPALMDSDHKVLCRRLRLTRRLAEALT